MFIKSGHISSPNLGMKIPWCGKIGTGKFPQLLLKAHFIFPNHSLAVMVKINFPSCGKARSGEIYFHYDC